MRIVPIEINVGSYEFSRRNLKELGYEDIVVVLEGSESYTTKETYDKICVTASCPWIPEPL